MCRKKANMLVETFSGTPGKTALHVGVENAQRFFPEKISEIDLHLGHLQIRCSLNPEFWQGKPEIFDERLSAWLESKYLHGKRDRTPIRLAMVQIGIGTNIFRLRPVSLDEQRKGKQKDVEKAVQPHGLRQPSSMRSSLLTIGEFYRTSVFGVNLNSGTTTMRHGYRTC